MFGADRQTGLIVMAVVSLVVILSVMIGLLAFFSHTETISRDLIMKGQPNDKESYYAYTRLVSPERLDQPVLRKDPIPPAVGESRLLAGPNPD